MSFYSPDKIGKLTEQMVGYNLTTKQTPPEGVLVKKVKKLQLHIICYYTETKFTTSHSEAVSYCPDVQPNFATVRLKQWICLKQCTFIVCFGDVMMHILARPKLRDNTPKKYDYNALYEYW